MANADDVRAAAREVLFLDHDGDVDNALARAHALAAAHPESAIAHRLVGDLRYAAAIHAMGGDESEEFRTADATLHLRVARDALEAAKRLAPDCVDVAATLGDVLCASKMFRAAESEFRRAQNLPCPVDPAENNAAYGMYDEDQETTAAERVEEVREHARRSYVRMTVEELVPMMVSKAMDAARELGAAEGRKVGKRVAENFPTVGRAQYLNAYMDLEFVRGLDASIDRRPFLLRTLTIAERAVNAFPRSPVLASFHAKLLFVLGEYHAAEMECRRGLCMKEPDDPRHDCIPPGSITGESRGERLVMLSSEFHELINKIVMLAGQYWESMSSDRQQDFLSVRLDVLQHEYDKIDPSRAFTLSGARNFVRERGSWRFWACPICDSKKFIDIDLLLSHMCGKHPRAVLPRLLSLLDRKISDKALEEEEDSLDGVSLCQDSDQQDMVSFDRRSGTFKWLFYAPSSGIIARPFSEIREMKRQKAIMLLESIKEKMKNLPVDKSSTELVEALPEINDLWHNFLRTSAIDYRAMIATIARSFLWKELKKRMTEDHKAAAKFISTADIDAAFTKGADDTHGAPKITEGHDESEVQATENSETAVKGLADPPINVTESSEVQVTESSETTVKDTESPDPPFNQTESHEVQATEISETAFKDAEFPDPLINVATETAVKDTELPDAPINVAETSEVQATESSETAVMDTELQDPAINATESGNDQDTEMENFIIVGTIPCYFNFEKEKGMKNLQIDPNSGGPITTTEASSSDSTGEQV